MNIIEVVVRTVGWMFVAALAIAIAVLNFPLIVVFLIWCVITSESPFDHISVWKHINTGRNRK